MNGKWVIIQEKLAPIVVGFEYVDVQTERLVVKSVIGLWKIIFIAQLLDIYEGFRGEGGGGMKTAFLIIVVGLLLLFLWSPWRKKGNIIEECVIIKTENCGIKIETLGDNIIEDNYIDGNKSYQVHLK